jgi:DNA segregation ATPase FtsK/SpoIIIE-like protein
MSIQLAPPSDEIDLSTAKEKALEIITTYNRASVSLIQREMKIRYFVAATILEALEKDGFVTAPGLNGVRTVVAHPTVEPASENKE